MNHNNHIAPMATDIRRIRYIRSLTTSRSLSILSLNTAARWPA